MWIKNRSSDVCTFIRGWAYAWNPVWVPPCFECSSSNADEEPSCGHKHYHRCNQEWWNIHIARSIHYYNMLVLITYENDPHCNPTFIPDRTTKTTMLMSFQPSLPQALNTCIFLFCFYITKFAYLLYRCF